MFDVALFLNTLLYDLTCFSCKTKVAIRLSFCQCLSTQLRGNRWPSLIVNRWPSPIVILDTPWQFTWKITLWLYGVVFNVFFWVFRLPLLSNTLNWTPVISAHFWVGIIHPARIKCKIIYSNFRRNLQKCICTLTFYWHKSSAKY